MMRFPAMPCNGRQLQEETRSTSGSFPISSTIRTRAAESCPGTGQKASRSNEYPRSLSSMKRCCRPIAISSETSSPAAANCRNSRDSFHIRLLSLERRKAEVTGIRAKRIPGTSPVTRNTAAQTPSRTTAPSDSSKVSGETPSRSSIRPRHRKISTIARTIETTMCSSVSVIVSRSTSLPEAPYDLCRAISLDRPASDESAIRI